MQLTTTQHNALLDLLKALVDQERARIIVPANEAKEGFWFGGGNLVCDSGGVLWLSGRYRNYGDSRTGIEGGARGLECAIFCSTDGGEAFEKVQRWTKADLSREDERVLSIEGTAIHRLPDGSWELFVSTEKDITYPEGFEGYQKPGTGVWSIDRLAGPTLDYLDASALSSVITTDRPEHLHVKDPVVFDDGDVTNLLFCSHPISWASSNTGLATRQLVNGEFDVQTWQLVPRGNIWDVAATRVTNYFAVPQRGVFEDAPSLAVLFYDGAESMRQLDENPRALKRPRGYSCEELGGAMWAPADNLQAAQRLSLTLPLFVSPHGTGSSRYVSTLVTEDGIYATWQQSQPDASQSLVMNYILMDEVERLLS